MKTYTVNQHAKNTLPTYKKLKVKPLIYQRKVIPNTTKLCLHIFLMVLLKLASSLIYNTVAPVFLQ